MNNTDQENYQKNDSSPRHRMKLVAISICLLAISSPNFAADDEYLRSLEAESNNSRGSATSNSGSGSGNNYLDALSDEAESSAKVTTADQHDDAYFEALKKMEALLENKKPSTYKFYKKLTPKKQALVFEQYAADKSDDDTRLSHLKKQVMDLYFKR